MARPSPEQIEKYKNENPSEVTTHDISGVEIFSIGNWNGDGYTGADLDAMAESFSAIGDRLKPYLKLGHGDKQSLLKSDELPAAGWVKGVRRMGNKLVADFVGVPRKIYQLLKAGAYKRLSVEIYPKLKIDGKDYRNALKAIALLGGETPAVQNLDDILALYAACGPASAFGDNEGFKVYEYNPALAGDNGDKKMDELTAAKARIVALETENADLKSGELKKFSDENKVLKADAAKSAEALASEKARADAAEAQVQQFKDKAEAQEIESAVSSLIEKKKIAPAHKEAVSAMLRAAKGSAQKFSVGGKEKPISEIVSEYFASSPDLAVNTDDESEVGENINTDLATEAKKYAADNKVSADEALIAVARKREKKA